jgi:hypothetical protein
MNTGIYLQCKNAYLVPYEIVVTKIKNNPKKPKKHAS